METPQNKKTYGVLDYLNDKSGKTWDEWMAEQPKDPWYVRAWWSTYRFFRDIPYRFRRGKAFFIRGWRGWAPMDTWSFDHYLAPIILGGLQQLKKDKHGWPSICENEEEWDAILDKMIWTFETTVRITNNEWEIYRREWISTLQEDEPDVTYESMMEQWQDQSRRFNFHIMTEEEIARYDEGWDLFRKYYFCLWD